MQSFFRDSSIKTSLSIVMTAMATLLLLLSALGLFTVEKGKEDTTQINRVGVVQSNMILQANIHRLRARTQLGMYVDNAETRNSLSVAETKMRLDNVDERIAVSRDFLAKFAVVPEGAPEKALVEASVAAFTNCAGSPVLQGGEG